MQVLVLPGVARAGAARAEQVSKAAYSYLAESLGILLMTAGGLPAVRAVFSRTPLATTVYMELLAVFIIGGAIFLWHDGKLRKIEKESKIIPEALFFYSWKCIGMTITVLAGLSLLLQTFETFGDIPRLEGMNKMSMLLYGLILCWFTIEHQRHNDLPSVTSIVGGSKQTPKPAATQPVVAAKIALKPAPKIMPAATVKKAKKAA